MTWSVIAKLRGALVKRKLDRMATITGDRCIDVDRDQLKVTACLRDTDAHDPLDIEVFTEGRWRVHGVVPSICNRFSPVMRCKDPMLMDYLTHRLRPGTVPVEALERLLAVSEPYMPPAKPMWGNWISNRPL